MYHLAMNRKSTLMLVAIAALSHFFVVAKMHKASRQKALKGASKPPKAKPVVLQTWEGEGGALPVTGSQVGPDPSNVTPRTSW